MTGEEIIKKFDEENPRKNTLTMEAEIMLAGYIDEQLTSLRESLEKSEATVERLAGALRMVKIANHVDVRKPSEECLKSHYVILLPIEDNQAIEEALALIPKHLGGTA